MGEETFRKGVQAYLAAHLYGNATAEDFWDAQTRVSGLPVDKVMRSFVEQPGVPLVTLASDDGSSMPVTQAQILAVGMRQRLETDADTDALDDPDLLQERWTCRCCFGGRSSCSILGQSTTAVRNSPSISFMRTRATRGITGRRMRRSSGRRLRRMWRRG